MAYEYDHLAVEVAGRLATVTIDNPPINLITRDLFRELVNLSETLQADRELSVVVVRSANPDFFIAHFDVESILSFPGGPDAAEAQKSFEVNPFHAMCERFRTMDKVTIAQIEGRVGGGGSELAASMDMRFGVRGKTKINQMEVPIGILPGGTGTQRLPRLMGRGRAMEVILGGDDLDAETAERWGYLNRIFEADQIGPFVDKLARRIAGFPVESVRLGKQAVNEYEQPLAQGLANESYLFQRLLRTENSQKFMKAFLEKGGQTHDGEMRVGELNGELADD
jgi:enoyl-CoA hydratase/carnithine racemase